MEFFHPSLETQYFILFGVILILPKVLLRFRIPGAITALLFGFFTAEFLGWFEEDQLLLMLSRLGITSLFLFAGMEVDLKELRSDSKVLTAHVLKGAFILLVTAFVLMPVFSLSFQVALLLSLGLMTPSTGFILNSLKQFDLSTSETYWIRSKAIAKELVAILILFFALQEGSMEGLLISLGVIIAIILLLPVLFDFFLRKVIPFAPDSEVSFLLLTALACGVITTKMGTYYLVGAFIVGMTASRFKTYIPKEKNEQIMSSIGYFFSFFVPFYFYKAGLGLSTTFFRWEGIYVGLAFTAVALPIRTAITWSSIWFFLRDYWANRRSISTALMPTLIFALVIASILKNRFEVQDSIVGGLMVYCLLSSIIPAIFLERASNHDYQKITI